MNRCLAKSGQQKTIPCHRNGGKPFLGELFLNGRLDFVESIKNYGAVCEFPLAPGHDMQMKRRKRGMKTLFIILFLQKGPEAMCVTSATFLCCTPATNTDVVGAKSRMLNVLCILDVRLWKNLPLSSTNGHLILCWELHSRCLFCISNADCCNLFNFLRLRSVSFRNVFSCWGQVFFCFIS